ncbi:HNH endonuclease signature motif containing protein [Chryseobacterium zhengzhouense]|uniref:HNH endonuclease signature motif containing protein n=1 Tax=Chryseobacterium zhengzhouense TaxID=1636086 RepID=A0ABW2LVL0_9FLAO
MREERPAIPDPIAREVRQRCGFGCVICGCPIVDYEHMLEWAQVKRHVADEITLLCPDHHRAKTARRLPLDKIIEANRNPYNLRQSFSTPNPLYYYGNTAIIKFGNSTFSMSDHGSGAVMIPLMVSNTPLIQVNLLDQHFLLNILLCDEKNNIILIIKDNAIQYSVGTWDVEYTGRTIIIRQASRNIFIDIEFIAPHTVHFKRGKFYFNGNSFEIKNNSLILNGTMTFSSITIAQTKVGINI